MLNNSIKIEIVTEINMKLYTYQTCLKKKKNVILPKLLSVTFDVPSKTYKIKFLSIFNCQCRISISSKRHSIA